MIPTPTVSNIMTSMRSFLTAVLPDDVAIVQGQPNRVPEPPSNRYVVMMPPRFGRLETNVDSYSDAKFTAAIVGVNMTVSAVDPDVFGHPIGIGSVIIGAGVAPNTAVQSMGTGKGGIGTYVVTVNQNVGEGVLSAGIKTITMASDTAIQLDFHATDGSSGDLATTVAALFRDAFGVQQFKNQIPNYGTVPLYADDPQQRPFLNDSQQIEWRWIVEAYLQANISVVVPMQFADAITLGIISVDAAYPPT